MCSTFSTFYDISFLWWYALLMRASCIFLTHFAELTALFSSKNCLVISPEGHVFSVAGVQCRQVFEKNIKWTKKTFFDSTTNPPTNSVLSKSLNLITKKGEIELAARYSWLLLPIKRNVDNLQCPQRVFYRLSSDFHFPFTFPNGPQSCISYRSRLRGG